MSYLVLARKWRPKTFSEVTGQSHIVQALENALNTGRVHHAFLFAGTRGVGKTTLARILAKALNCEEGVSAEPCGVCSACTSLDEGRFVDLIEIDAASRTGVDDMRDLLDNVQYAPTAGRYKVYLIDEVHMLSKSSFNALLKTLEEPPEHVKFLLATTDPQKLPVTVLSRCLQFNLKRMTAGQIVERLAEICSKEKLSAESAALKRIGRAAAGSMRDALSLMEQALAYGAEELRDDDVAEMLGTMDRRRIIELLDCLDAGDGSSLIAAIDQFDELVPDYAVVLDEIATALQRIAVIQLAGADAVDDEQEHEALVWLSKALHPEQVQLYYQIAIRSRADLALAPDPRSGFEMALLRMLAFKKATLNEAVPVSSGTISAPPRQAPARPAKTQTKTRAPKAADTGQAKKTAANAGPDEDASIDDVQSWPTFIAGLSLDGAVSQLAAHCALETYSPFELRLLIHQKNEHLLTDKLKQRLISVIQQKVGSGIAVHFNTTDKDLDTLAESTGGSSARAVRKAQDAISHDPDVQELVDVMGGKVIEKSIQPVDQDLPSK